MTGPNFSIAKKQDGAILIIALMFLVAITIFTISSMRSSRIGLHMAQNDESRIAAVQTAQALSDAIIANPASTPVIGKTGYTACTSGESSCNRNDLAVENSTLVSKIDSDFISARVERVGTVFRPPPRAVESSLDKFSAASFTITTTFDRAEDGLGRQQVSEGVLVLVSKQ